MCIICSVGDVTEGTCPDCGVTVTAPWDEGDGIKWCSAECAAPYYEGVLIDGPHLPR